MMGIDYGTKRIGVAFTDDSGVMAFPHAVVPNDGRVVEILETLIKERGVARIIVGHSKDLGGKDNAVQADISDFIGDLTLRTGLPIELEPEQYSTQAALRLQGRNEMTDASAAALILDSFIIRNKKNL